MFSYAVCPMDLEHNRQNFTLAFYICGMFHQQDDKLTVGKAMSRYYILDNQHHAESQERYCSYQVSTLSSLTLHDIILPRLGVMSKTSKIGVVKSKIQ